MNAFRRGSFSCRESAAWPAAQLALSRKACPTGGQFERQTQHRSGEKSWKDKVNIHDVIDEHRIGRTHGRTQYVALALCALLMLFDGFNTQTISYIVPVLASEWHLPKSILGTIFSAAFVGLLIGNFGISPLANRFGRKKMTILSTAAFGVLTLFTVLVTNAPQLIAIRLLTGIALGAAAPCAIGLTSEFSPKRTRATFVLLIYVGYSLGYSLGFTVAGFCCGAMIPSFGWAGPLWVGGLGPIVLTLLLIPFLPESASYLARRRSTRRSVACCPAVLSRVHLAERRRTDFE